jgi:hypothetical protein
MSSSSTVRPQAASPPAESTAAPRSPPGSCGDWALSLGSVFVGTVAGVARMLPTGARQASPGGSDVERAERIVTGLRSHDVSSPGFGHPKGKPDDPRTAHRHRRRRRGVGRHSALIPKVSKVAERQIGKVPLLNVTGAISSDLGIVVGSRGASVSRPAPSGSSPTCTRSSSDHAVAHQVEVSEGAHPQLSDASCPRGSHAALESRNAPPQPWWRNP